MSLNPGASGGYCAPFHFCPRCGAGEGAWEATGVRRMDCRGCGFTLFLNVAAAAGIFLENAAGELLLIRRAKDPAKGLLSVPGGFADPGETLEEALRREVREEVGLEVGAIQFLASFPNDYPYRGVLYPTIDLYFTGRMDTFGGARALEEAQELVVRRPEDFRMEELAFDPLRRAMAVLRGIHHGV